MQHQKLTKQHNALHRKLKRAMRLQEPYAALLNQLDLIDDKLSSMLPQWRKRAYKRQ